MGKKISRFFTETGFVFVFALVLFALIGGLLVLIGITAYFLIRTGRMAEEIYANPYAIMVVIYCVSLAIGITAVVVCNRVVFKPLRGMIHAMNRLAAGDFDTRVEENTSRLQPREVKEFTRSFNTAAAELGSTEMLRRDFINDFSHEFKTPIVSLGGFARLLREDALPKEAQQEYLDIIIDEADRLADLATNVLNMSRVEAQTILTGTERFNISEQVRRAALMAQSKWAKKQAELVVDLEELEYTGNPEMLQQVWTNLLDNAFKFSPEGGKIEIQLCRKEQGVQLRLRDYGPGMDAATQKRIFEKFYQGDASRHVEGNGLGLSMVRKIVALHGGKIQVHSHPGGGSAFTVLLPQ